MRNVLRFVVVVAVFCVTFLSLREFPFDVRASVQKLNLATDTFGILPAVQLPTFGVSTDNVTASSYAIACGTSISNSDNGHLKVFSNTGSIAVTVFQAGTTGCAYAPAFGIAGVSTSGAGTITITPTTSQINKNGGSYGSTQTITAGQSFRMFTDVSSSGCATNGCWDLLVP